MELKSSDDIKIMNDKQVDDYLASLDKKEPAMDYGARFEKKKDNDFDIDSYINDYRESKSTKRSSLFGGSTSENSAVKGWVIIIMCVLMFLVFSARVVEAARELSIETITVKATVTDTEKKSELVRTGRSSGLQTYYYITYEWVGDNDRLNVGVRKTKDVAHPLVGDVINIEVREDNHNIELDSDDANIATIEINSLLCAVWVVLGVAGYIRYIKQ